MLPQRVTAFRAAHAASAAGQSRLGRRGDELTSMRSARVNEMKRSSFVNGLLHKKHEKTVCADVRETLLSKTGVVGVSMGGGSGGGGMSGPAAKRWPLSPESPICSSGMSVVFQVAPMTKLPPCLKRNHLLRGLGGWLHKLGKLEDRSMRAPDD